MQIYPTIGVAIVCLTLSACGNSAVEEEPVTVEQSMQELLNLDPASPAEVRVLLENGSYEQAFKAANGILVNRPGDPEALLLSGEALLKLGRPQEALPYFENAAATETFRAEALQGWGIALYQSGKRDQAVGQLAQAVALNPELWRAYNALGSIYDSDSAWAQAEAAYQSALSIQPNSALLHNNLAMSYMLQRRYDDAVPEFNRALVLDPSLKTAQTNLRMAYAFNGRYLEALAGVPERDMPDALNNVGYAAMVRGDYDVAEAYFTQAMETSPSYNSIAAANLDKLKAIRLTQSGDFDDAGVILQ